MSKFKSPEEFKKLIQQQNDQVKSSLAGTAKPAAAFDKAIAQAEKLKGITKAEKD